MVWAEIIRILAALIAVLGLIGLCALAARKAGLVAASGGLNRKRRLALVETLAIDPKRRIAIIKCDDKEHLIMLGAAGETLIEAGIPAAATVAFVPADSTGSAMGPVDLADQRPNPFSILRALKKHTEKAGALPEGDLKPDANAA